VGCIVVPIVVSLRAEKIAQFIIAIGVVVGGRNTGTIGADKPVEVVVAEVLCVSPGGAAGDHFGDIPLRHLWWSPDWWSLDDRCAGESVAAAHRLYSREALYPSEDLAPSPHTFRRWATNEQASLDR
jgi:hypothetical protein